MRHCGSLVRSLSAIRAPGRFLVIVEQRGPHPPFSVVMFRTAVPKIIFVFDLLSYRWMKPSLDAMWMSLRRGSFVYFFASRFWIATCSLTKTRCLFKMDISSIPWKWRRNVRDSNPWHGALPPCARLEDGCYQPLCQRSVAIHSRPHSRSDSNDSFKRWASDCWPFFFSGLSPMPHKSLTQCKRERRESEPSWRATQESVVFTVFQRLAAAFLAISDRCSGVRAAALAAPPFLPPSRPNATAASFLTCGGSSLGTSPEAWSTMNLATWFRSRCGLLDRVGMVSHTNTDSKTAQASQISN